MDRFKKLLPSILLILFEIAVGILLLINPERFTIAVFIIFGSVLILCAVAMLIRYLKDRKTAEKAFAEAKKQAKKDNKPAPEEPDKVSFLPLVSAVVTFVFGAVFAFGAGALYDLTLLIVVFYGAIMIIKGIFKITDYASLKKEGAGVSVLRLAVGILSVLLGIVMIVFSREARDTAFIIAAVSLLVEAALDIMTLVLGEKISKRLETTAREVTEDKKLPYDPDDFVE